MSWFGTPHFAMQILFRFCLGARFRVQTHARHEPQASGAVSLLSAIATALSTAATAALEVVVVRPALVAHSRCSTKGSARPDMSLSTVRKPPQSTGSGKAIYRLFALPPGRDRRQERRIELPH
jgi:hypothetical protein